MKGLTIHGPRGSTAFSVHDPTGLHQGNSYFGGNSSCYTLNTGKDLFILDAGTGLITAEEQRLKIQPENTYILFSHTHHDHIEGLGVTGLPYIPGTDLKLYGPKFLEAGLRRRFAQDTFPISLDGMPGIAEINSMGPAAFTLGDVSVDTWMGIHPIRGSMGYRLGLEDKVLVYATDMEFDFLTPEKKAMDDVPKDIYRHFIRNADVLIADAHFTKEEYESGKGNGFGHSYPEQIAEMAVRAGVKHLVFSHHAPRRTDGEIFELTKELADYVANGLGSAMTTEFARQGSIIVL